MMTPISNISETHTIHINETEESQHVTMEFHHDQDSSSPVLTCIKIHDPCDIPPMAIVSPKSIQILSPKSSLALLPTSIIASTFPPILTNPHSTKLAHPQHIYHRFEIISHLCIFMVGMAFFAWVYPLREITWGLCITRLCAGSINCATFITLITINPDAMRFLVLHAYGERWLPLDRMKQIHAKLGILIAIDGLIHAIIHMTKNASRIVEMSSTRQGLERLCQLLRTCPYSLSTTYSDMILSRSGMTGILLVIVMTLIVATSMLCIRKRNFSLFHYVHWCYIAYVILLPIHGSQGISMFPMSWLFVTPVLWLWYSNIKHWLYPTHATLYIQPIPPISSKPEPARARVAFVRMLVPGVIDILPGMYIRMRVPMINGSHTTNDWHPFTVTNASYILKHCQPHTLLHLLISAAGNWSTRLINNTITYPNKKKAHNTDAHLITPHDHDHLPPTCIWVSTPVHTLQALFRGPFMATIPAQLIASPHLILVGMGVGATPVLTMLHYLLRHLEYQQAHDMDVEDEKQLVSSSTPSQLQLQLQAQQHMDRSDCHTPTFHHDFIPAPIQRIPSSSANTSHFSVDPFTFSTIVSLQRQQTQTQEHVHHQQHKKSDTIVETIKPPSFKRAASEKLLSRPSSVRLHLFRSKSAPPINTSDLDPIESPIAVLIRQPLSMISHHAVRDVMIMTDHHGMDQLMKIDEVETQTDPEQRATTASIHQNPHPPPLTRTRTYVTGIAQTESSSPQLVRLPSYHLTSQVIDHRHTQWTLSPHVSHNMYNVNLSTSISSPHSNSRSHPHRAPIAALANDSESGLGAIRTVEVFLVARTWVEIISVLFPFIPVEEAKYGPLPFIPSDAYGDGDGDGDGEPHPLASRLPMRLHLRITRPEITAQQVHEWNSNPNKIVAMDISANLIDLSRVVSRLLKITASVTHTRPNFNIVFNDVQQHYAASYVHPVPSIPPGTCTTPISIPIGVYGCGAEPVMREIESVCHNLSKKSIATANGVTVEFAFSAEYV